MNLSLIDVVFDRKDHGRFPEMKEVKQLVRTVIAPEMGLGHSDSKVKSAEPAAGTPAEAAQGREETMKSEAVTATPTPATSGAAVTAQVDEDDEDSTVHDKECKTCL